MVFRWKYSGRKHGGGADEHHEDDEQSSGLNFQPNIEIGVEEGCDTAEHEEQQQILPAVPNMYYSDKNSATRYDNHYKEEECVIIPDIDRDIVGLNNSNGSSICIGRRGGEVLEMEHTLSEHEQINALQHQQQHQHDQQQIFCGGRTNIGDSNSSSSSGGTSSSKGGILELEHTLSEHEEFNAQVQRQQQRQEQLEQLLQLGMDGSVVNGGGGTAIELFIDDEIDDDVADDIADAAEDNDNDEKSEHYYVDGFVYERKARHMSALMILFFVFLIIIGSLTIAICVQKYDQNQKMNERTGIDAIQSGVSQSSPPTNTSSPVADSDSPTPGSSTAAGDGSSSSHNDIFEHDSTTKEPTVSVISDEECTYNVSVDRECYDIGETIGVDFTACGLESEWFGIWNADEGVDGLLYPTYNAWSWTCGGIGQSCGDESPSDGTVSFSAVRSGNYKVYLLDGDSWPATYKAASIEYRVSSRCDQDQNEDGNDDNDESVAGDSNTDSNLNSSPTATAATPAPIVSPTFQPTVYPPTFLPAVDVTVDHRSKYSVSYTRPPSFGLN